jgi:serpin B
MDDVNEYSRSLRTALMDVDPSTELAIANSIWYREGLPVKTPFIDVNQTNYDAEVREINFSSPDALTQINGWCARQTKDKIPEILEKISGDVMMYLINAVYFKGVWVYQFDKEETKEEDFYLPDGTTRKVDMMHQQASLNYTADENAKYLELPYGNQAFSMIFILQHDGKTTDDVAAQLESETRNDRMKSLGGLEVNLRLPRFKAECKYLLEENILPAMEMITPFDPYSADFGGISDQRLYISSVIHKTYADVNEEGTEAAAVTAVEVGFTSSGPGMSSPMPFTVNKPFLFAIRERSTGIILFMGRMEAP